MSVTGGAGIVVLGLGNVLMGDDGFGPTVIRTFEARFEPDPGVSVIDAGTPGLDLSPFLSGVRAAIIVDTVKSDGPPGTIRTYRRGEILAHPPQPRMSPHDPGLKETLLALEFAGDGPGEVLLVGAVPEHVATGPGLTAALRAAVEPAVEAVIAELDRLAARPHRRAAPVEPDLWWERA